MAIKPIDIIIKAKDEASGVFSTMGGKVAAVGASIAAYFGINAFVGAVKGAADLEAKLSEVAAVSEATAAEMVQLRAAAESAGASTKFTATEAADALGNLSRAGLSAKDAIASLPAVLQLAQAGGIGLAQAAEYVTKTIMGLGLSFSDAGRVADVLAKGANASNTSVVGLAQALSYAAPLAKTLGLSLEMTVAIIGKFADAGIDASRAGTALNAIMAQFADPASKFRTELAGAGITTTNFEKALRQLAAAGPAGSKAINAVGTEAGPALRALLNQGIGALDDLKGKLDNAAGSAAKTAAVMQGNLNGAFNSLGSAWDTVKNALMTPVLPVLTQGMNDLATAFKGMVESGTIAKFGAAITAAFEGAIKWVKAFAAEIDFSALAVRLQGFAASAQETFTKIGDYATNAGNIVKSAYGVMSAGANGVLTAFYSMGLAFSESAAAVVKASLWMTEALQKIAIGDARKRLQDEAEMMRVTLAGLTGVSEAMAQKVNKSFVAVGDSAQLVRDGVAGLASSIQAAGTQANASSPAIEKLSAAEIAAGNEAKIAEFRTNELALSFENAGAKAKESGDKQQAAATATKEKVAALRAEYQAAVDTGNWQLAVEKLTELKNAAKAAESGTADQKKKAEEDAAAIAAAFEAMGIKTKTELETLATVAKQRFELIKASGTAAVGGVQTAFEIYAKAAITANNGVATEALKVEAAMNKVSITTDSTGKTIVKSMVGTENAIAAVAEAYHQLGIKTPEELNKIAATNAQAWDKVKNDSRLSVADLQTAFKAYAESAIAANNGVANEAIKSEAAMRGLQIQTDGTGKTIVSAMGSGKDATDGLKRSIDKSTDAFGEQKLAALAAADAIKKQQDQQARLDTLGKAATDDYNSLPATLQRKMKDGSLSGADQKDAQNSFDAAKNNLATVSGSGSIDFSAVQSAQERYNDARRVLDATSKSKASNDSAVDEVDRANSQISQTTSARTVAENSAQNQIDQVKNLLDVAKAKGDVYEQTRLQKILDTESIALKKIEQGYLSQEASDLDALASAKERLAKAQGEFNAQTAAEINALRAQAQTKRSDSRVSQSDSSRLTALENVATQKAAQQAPTQATTPGKTYTVNIIGVGDYQASSDTAAKNLIALLQRSKLSA